jgi:tyrosine-protein kinase Etk/Wzc
MKKREAEQAAKAATAAQAEEALQTQPTGQEDAAATATSDRPAGPVHAPPKREPSGTRGKRPASPRKSGYSELLQAYHHPGASVTEEYRSARISMITQCNDGKFCYLVTSSDAKEGKTLTCATLAAVLAEREDRRTVLVDGDLRKADLAGLLNARNTPGVAEMLRGIASPQEIIQKTVYPNLFFIPAGQAEYHEAGELLTRPELEDLVTYLRQQYDYVLLDTPPINKAPDAGLVGRCTGEGIVVVRMNKTSRESVDKAIRLLHAANVKVHGIILTHQHDRKSRLSHYLYRCS